MTLKIWTFAQFPNNAWAHCSSFQTTILPFHHQFTIKKTVFYGRHLFHQYLPLTNKFITKIFKSLIIILSKSLQKKEHSRSLKVEFLLFLCLVRNFQLQCCYINQELLKICTKGADSGDHSCFSTYLLMDKAQTKLNTLFLKQTNKSFKNLKREDCSNQILVIL